MSHCGLGWAARDPARDYYIVAIAPPRPGTFLTHFPLPQAFESLPNARYGEDVVMAAGKVPALNLDRLWSPLNGQGVGYPR